MIEYRTVAREAEISLVERKSKFLARVKPVSSVEEAEGFLEGIRKKHWNATHNVPAYIIGAKAEIQKYSDDKEPSGTAGLPVLEILKAAGLANVAIVVTRYFGGTLLGRGGLIRAYAGAAKKAIQAAGIVGMVPAKKVAITVDYVHAGKIENELINRGITLADTEYSTDVTFNVVLLAKEREPLKQLLQEYTADEFRWADGDWVYQLVSLSQEECGQW